jgi:hypothetical protein
MLRSEMRRRCLLFLDEDPVAPVYFTTSEINDLIDEAMEVIAEEVRYEKRTGYVTLRPGVQFYNTLAVDELLISPTRVWLQGDSRPLEYTTIGELSYHERGWLDDVGERPHHWYAVDHSTLGIYPAVSEPTESLRIEYYGWPKPLANDQAIIPHDDATTDAMIQYVVYSGLMKRWDIARASDIYAEFAGMYQDAVFRKESRRFQYAMMERVNGHASDYRHTYR